MEGAITGLQSETEYFLKLVASNVNGSSSFDTTFNTISLAPLAEIHRTIDVTDTSAILRGKINPNSLATSYYFEYGPTPSMGTTSATYALPDTIDYLNIAEEVTGLESRKTYYYKLIATNSFAEVHTDSVSLYTAARPVIDSFFHL